jgi:hypothetical protein
LSADARAADRRLIEQALQVGLTALIPVPLLDDLARDALRRRLVRAVLVAEGATPTAGVVSALADEPGRGCLLGCPLALVVYPLKKLFRKVFFFLEVKRAVDLVSTSWHFAWLLQRLVRERRGAPPDAAEAARWRAAIVGALQEVGVRPVERAFGTVLRRSRRLLRAMADRLTSVLRPGSRAPENVEAAVASVEAEEHAAMSGVVAELSGVLDALPAEHFEDLLTALRRRLG